MSDFSHKEHKDHKGGGARRLAEPPQGDLSHAEAQRGGGRRDFRPSGVYYLPEIPCNWEIKKAKILFRQEKRPVRPEDGVVTCFRDGQVTLRTNRRTEGFTNSLKEIGYQGVRKGDLVIHNMDAFAGSVGVSESNGKMSPVCSICTPLRDDIDVRFYALVLRVLAHTGFIKSLAKGIRERSTDFRYSDFKEVLLPLPPRPEQKAIVAYLDAETGRIDKAIAAEEKMIALLQERREIVINEAVTPHDGWEVKPLRSFLCEVRELSKTGEELPLSLTANAGIVPFSEKSNRTLENDTYVGTKIVRKGQIVFNRFRARLFAVSGYDGLVSPDYAVFTVSKDVAAKFLVALFSTSHFKQRLNLLASGIGDGFSRVYASDLLRLKISLPPFPEQEAIVERLDRETGKIDRAIEVKRRQIELLRERRQIVIDEVVTGKVKVA